MNLKYIFKRKGFQLPFLIFVVSQLTSAQQKPNIVWIVCEDISPFIGVYGDPIVRTPNIDQLSSESVRYNRVYTTSGVCAPSRAAIITGMYPMSIGTQHMRTISDSKANAPEGVPNYSSILPSYVKAFPEYLRKVGYYTSNNFKKDYQFEEPVTVWDESSPAASFTNRNENQPFFSVFNLARTHESQMMINLDSLGYEPKKMNLPLYYEDTEIVRNDMAILYTRIEEMDKHVGEIIEILKKEGVYDNSFVFFYSDHGGNLPWQKREILERGTHIPFIVKYPNGKYAGTVNNDLISSIDFAPSILSLAGIEPPSYIQGKAFLGNYKLEKKNNYIFAARDRSDSKYDRVRSVFDGDFRYVYNFEPDKPKYQDLAYRKGIRTMQEILKMRDAGEIKNPYLLDWFNTPKPVEELYYSSKDPDEVNNLANNPAYQSKVQELKKELFNWINKVGDLSIMPEKEMVLNYWWNGKGEAPTTSKPRVKIKNGLATIHCDTEGVSIGYRIKSDESDDFVFRNPKSWDFRYFGHFTNSKPIKVSKPWKIYDGKPITINKGEKIIVNAQRIGYESSEITITVK